MDGFKWGLNIFYNYICSPWLVFSLTIYHTNQLIALSAPLLLLQSHHIILGSTTILFLYKVNFTCHVVVFVGINTTTVFFSLIGTKLGDENVYRGHNLKETFR